MCDTTTRLASSVAHIITHISIVTLWLKWINVYWDKLIFLINEASEECVYVNHKKVICIRYIFRYIGIMSRSRCSIMFSLLRLHGNDEMEDCGILQ